MSSWAAVAIGLAHLPLSEKTIQYESPAIGVLFWCNLPTFSIRPSFSLTPPCH
jgi:hypothetical protein